MKNADGEVAVLVSPGFGAGWSTWAPQEHREFLTTDNILVEMAQRGAEVAEVEAYIKSYDVDCYAGGWKDVEVEWMVPGTSFIIEEYDGYESIRTTADFHLST